MHDETQSIQQNEAGCLDEGISETFAQAAADTAQKMRILVADSNSTIRKLLRHGLANEDYEIIEAGDGNEALKLAMQRPEPHAILIDAGISGINGLEVVRRLKSDMQYRTIPVIVMTSSDANEDINEAVEAGADEFLSKPISRGELKVRIRSITRMHRGNSEMIGAESVALSLARAVSSKDGYSSGHVEQVANVAVEFGKLLGMDSAELKMLRYGAILHNVGKIAIPDSILEKTGPLTPRERALFHQHPRVGCDICGPLQPLRPVLPIIRHHKEHFDGTGYPDGLRGDAIPLKAQVVGIVDVYSALTNDRPFRRAKTNAEAVEILRDRAFKGMHDPELISKFCDMIGELSSEPENQTDRCDTEGELTPVPSVESVSV
ncbi:Cyclic di-GMP phosphodiesterase response regulator RpfG [Rubripirellula obstinata]|uniref:Cyclic di-GMP phosphodiesterase response regulator RpfG n=1 Tax=Rubripirellula obstinata TaxID=406547 RepID=A0A5B1CC59_9BACT|nr:HD domain-containing phosphohydrolase [Rubripirellula obstinata]KAA1258717.1 Cyclic di-GMP phosphodiesterase response regulator RpfG [Rubripirellula obstinata]